MQYHFFSVDCDIVECVIVVNVEPGLHYSISKTAACVYKQ